jgi:NAD(P)-dependent dehydrogenase (short-subunit alcohol dehydrogenase family)
MSGRLFSLKGKVALIAGGSGGIGRAIALAFAEAGADLVVSSRNKRPPDLEKVAEEIQAKGGKALAIPAPVGKKEDGQNLVQKTLKEFGRIDILVNNAGVNPVLSTLLDLEEEAFEKGIEVNLKGAFFMSEAVAKERIKQLFV